MPLSAMNIMRGTGTKVTKSLGVAVLAAYALQPVMAEEEPSAVGVSMSATLIGSISFVMCLYYFINYDDPDIKAKSWETISGTISIFCAVLMFSTFNDLTEAYLIDPLEEHFGGKTGAETHIALMVDMAHMFFWIILLQIALGWLSKATGPWQVDAEKYESEEMEGEKEELLEVCEVNMACWAVLLAHITGFASINAFGTVQQMYFNSSPFKAFMCVPVAFAFQMIVQRVTDTVRERIALGDDDKKDEFEEMWDAEAEEAENDVMGLTLSFLTINALRFGLTGCLPNQEGKEEECQVEEYLFAHTTGQKIGLVSMAFLFAGLLGVVYYCWPEWLEEKVIEKEYEEAKALMTSPDQKAPLKAEKKKKLLLGRLAEAIACGIAMCFSWSLFYGFQMVIAGMSSTFKGESELLSVVLALAISISVMFALLPLDWLADQDWTGPACDRAIRGIMTAMALTIGFSWEQCFDACVDAIALTAKGCSIDIVNQHTTKLFLSTFCASLLVPAWKWYMLPFMVKKGWNYGYVFCVEDLEALLPKLVRDEKKEEDEEEEGAPVNEKKLAKARKMHAAILDQAEGDLIRKKSGKNLEEATGSYKELAGDDVEALRRKNQQLEVELAKAKAASNKAQAMLDSTMENLFTSLKQMHVTVTKIETQNNQ